MLINRGLVISVTVEFPVSVFFQAQPQNSLVCLGNSHLVTGSGTVYILKCCSGNSMPSYQPLTAKSPIFSIPHLFIHLFLVLVCWPFSLEIFVFINLDCWEVEPYLVMPRAYSWLWSQKLLLVGLGAHTLPGIKPIFSGCKTNVSYLYYIYGFKVYFLTLHDFYIMK